MENKSIKLEHFNNLVSMAFADGVLDDDEKAFLLEKGEEFDLPEVEVQKAIDNADSLEFIVPDDEDEREEQLTDIVYLMMIDGEIHDKEYQLCLNIARKLEFDEEDLNDVIELTKKLWK